MSCNVEVEGIIFARSVSAMVRIVNSFIRTPARFMWGSSTHLGRPQKKDYDMVGRPPYLQKLPYLGLCEKPNFSAPQD